MLGGRRGGELEGERGFLFFVGKIGCEFWEFSGWEMKSGTPSERHFISVYKM